MLAFLVRLPYVTLTPSHDDVDVYLADIEAIAVGGSFATTQLEHLAVELVMALFYLVFGRAGPNLASLTAALATVPVMGVVASALFDSNRVGVLTAVIVAILPIHIFYSSLLLIEPIALFVFALTLLCTVKRRWMAVVVVSSILLFMRFEYLLITIPLAVVLWTESERVRRAVIAVPFVFLFAGVVIGTVWDISVQQSKLFYQPIAQYLPISASFVGRFVRRPIFHLHVRFLFYIPQTIYWGVPFFSLPLLNPALPLFALAGIRSIIDDQKWTRRALYLLPVGVSVTFIYRELTELGVIPPVEVLTVFLGAIVFAAYARLAWTATDLRLAPLAVLAPYIALLSLRITAPRYLLPLVFIGTLYTGYGLCKAVAWATTDDRLELIHNGLGMDT